MLFSFVRVVCRFQYSYLCQLNYWNSKNVVHEKQSRLIFQETLNKTTIIFIKVTQRVLIGE